MRSQVEESDENPRRKPPQNGQQALLTGQRRREEATDNRGANGKHRTHQEVERSAFVIAYHS
jgi:hypothetical protein